MTRLRPLFGILLYATLSGCAGQQMADVLPFDDPNGGKITWYKDVLPIARAHCQGCHSPDGIGPFSMMSYEDAAPNAKLMAERTTQRLMPPWMPDPNCGQFQDDRRLDDDAIATIAAWYEGGAIEGNPSDAPAGGDTMAQHLPSSDSTLMPDTVYTPVGDPDDPKALDDYHCFILDPQLVQDRDLIGYEVIPGVPREVHHVILFPAKAAAAKAADDATPEPGWTCFGGPGTGGEAVLGGWAPGMPPVQYPPTTGIRMKATDVIVMQIHYNLLNGPPVPDRTIVKLDYSDGPVDKLAQILPGVNSDFVIPPHTNGYSSSASVKIPFSVKAWGVLPHMHTLGKRITLKTDSQCLVDIPAWDFHWQQLYFFKSPTGVTLNAGETATLTCTWNNPRDTEVRWGESTTDEMCVNFLYLTY